MNPIHLLVTPPATTEHMLKLFTKEPTARTECNTWPTAFGSTQYTYLLPVSVHCPPFEVAPELLVVATGLLLQCCCGQVLQQVAVLLHLGGQGLQGPILWRQLNVHIRLHIS